LAGGLGNQLFQIFTTISYALKYSKPFFFLNNYQLGNGSNGVTIRYTYWETFLSKLKPFLKNLDEIPQLLTINEQTFNYSLLPETFEKNYCTLLVGYFQSPLYFNQYKNTICKLLGLDLNKRLVKIKSHIDFDNIDVISLHFRFGDYKKYPNIYPILDEPYYSNAINYILSEIRSEKCSISKQIQILWFCENDDLKEADNIITKLQLQFPLIKFQRANTLLEDWEQMLLISLCEYNIIANSTFSWWGAYLNDNPCKIVCYPDQWFMPQTNKNTKDLFPEDWSCIPLQLCSFQKPIYIE
jgi:hypothetical protein